MAVRRLLKSWPMPPASRLTASSCWACRKALLGLAALADVPPDAVRADPAVATVGHARADLDRDPAAALGDQLHLVRRGVDVSAELLLLGHDASLGRQEVLEVPPDDLLGLPPQQVRAGAVHRRDPPVGVHEHIMSTASSNSWR
jgi:hypothetical protein